MTKTHSRSLTDVIADIDSYLGLPPAPASAAAGSKATQAAAAPAERNKDVLHIIFDTKTNNFVGASLNGKLFSGAVGAHLTKDGASLLNLDGEDLLGAKAGVPEQRSQAAAPAQVAADILRFMSALSEGGDE